MHEQMLILGSGAAGWTAAIYAKRAGFDPLLLRGPQPGGQLTITTDVENYPGFADVIQGPWLMEQMEAQAQKLGVRIKDASIVGAKLSDQQLLLEGDGGEQWQAQTLIIATGSEAKWLGLSSEEKYKGFGVSACATCDGFFYKDKEVLVVGGGNTAVEEALFLTKFARRVRLIHRRDGLRAEKILQERVFANPKIEIIWNKIISEIIGEQTDKAGLMRKVTGAKIKDPSGGDESRLEADGVFIAIGHEPKTEMFRGQLAMGEDGVLETAPDSTATSIKGVYAAGDVADRIYRQAITAAGTGCMAALEAVDYLNKLDS